MPYLPEVKFLTSDDGRTGPTVLIDPDEWSLESGRDKVAWRKQLPLKLAWAISIHKSQGMTLEAAELDLASCFEPGHAYVALSRVVSLAATRLLSFDPSRVYAHPKVVAYYERLDGGGGVPRAAAAPRPAAAAAAAAADSRRSSERGSRRARRRRWRRQQAQQSRASRLSGEERPGTACVGIGKTESLTPASRHVSDPSHLRGCVTRSRRRDDAHHPATLRHHVRDPVAPARAVLITPSSPARAVAPSACPPPRRHADRVRLLLGRRGTGGGGGGVRRRAARAAAGPLGGRSGGRGVAGAVVGGAGAAVRLAASRCRAPAPASRSGLSAISRTGSGCAAASTRSSCRALRSSRASCWG